MEIEWGEVGGGCDKEACGEGLLRQLVGLPWTSSSLSVKEQTCNLKFSNFNPNNYKSKCEAEIIFILTHLF